MSRKHRRRDTQRALTGTEDDLEFVCEECGNDVALPRERLCLDCLEFWEGL